MSASENEGYIFELFQHFKLRIKNSMTEMWFNSNLKAQKYCKLMSLNIYLKYHLNQILLTIHFIRTPDF